VLARLRAFLCLLASSIWVSAIAWISLFLDFVIEVHNERMKQLIEQHVVTCCKRFRVASDRKRFGKQRA
jgi:hypothetical protein